MGKKIEEIDVLDAEKRRVPSKHYVYVILVKWSDGTALTVFRRYSRFFDLQARLLDRFPIEGGAIDPEKRVIPFLPGKIFFGRSHIKDVAMKRLTEINNYCKSLIKLPAHISECEEVLEFFEVEPEDLDPPTNTGTQEEGVYSSEVQLSADSTNSCNKPKTSKDKQAESISKPKRLEYYVAVGEYEVQASGEIPLQPGMKVQVVEKSHTGWWFVNSDEQQGWVPSTYLQPESGTDSLEKEGPMASPGQEENHICIENFEAGSTDEVSLEKGAVVQVLQKNMDGWWLVRYQGREAYAPATYLKKTSNAHIVSMVQKSRLSGVEIIGSMQDVSNLLNQDAKTDKEKPALPPSNKSPSGTSSPSSVSQKATAVIKQRSLERGGRLVPPPRQNSVTKMNVVPVVNKSSTYVTAEDFSDTVGDGLSFQKGEKVQVIEKTSTGWWFVKMGDQEGWAPSSYLEPYSGPTDAPLDYELATQEEVNEDSGENDEDDDDWYAQPEEDTDGPEIIPATTQKAHPAKRPLPPVPPEDEEKSSSKTASRPLPPAPGSNKQQTPFKLPDSPPKPPVKKAPKPLQKSFSAEHTDRSQAIKENTSKDGSQDLSAILKAKFAARSGASVDSGNSSDEDSVRVSKPAVLKPESSRTQVSKSAAIPFLPSKPSDLKKTPQESISRISQGNTDKRPFAKPQPPAKSKPVNPLTPSKPSIIGDTQTSKQNVPSLPTKPALKPAASNGNQQAKSPEKGNVKGMAAVFSGQQNLKPTLSARPSLTKPVVATKPKPAISAKPSIPNKPAVSDKRVSQGLNNLIKNLDGKLSLGQSPPRPFENNNKPNVPSVTEQAAVIPAASSSKGSTYIALYDFVAENDGEIGFNEGDEVEVLEEQGDWCLICVWDEEGWAPSAYLQKQ